MKGTFTPTYRVKVPFMCLRIESTCPSVAPGKSREGSIA
jgi:hypothetical protein